MGVLSSLFESQEPQHQKPQTIIEEVVGGHAIEPSIAPILEALIQAAYEDLVSQGITDPQYQKALLEFVADYIVGAIALVEAGAGGTSPGEGSKIDLQKLQQDCQNECKDKQGADKDECMRICMARQLPHSALGKLSLAATATGEAIKQAVHEHPYAAGAAAGVAGVAGAYGLYRLARAAIDKIRQRPR